MALQRLLLAARDEMVHEARLIIDEATARQLVLRLYGGLAVRAHCDVISFCERDYSDVDMIGLAVQRVELRGLFADLGFAEEFHVAQATLGTQLAFVRPCIHTDGESRVHGDDRVDVFLDTFRMDHELHLSTRLTLDDYTISVTDQLLTKLQVFRLEEKDVRDVLTLLKDVELGEQEGRRTIGTAYIAARCAEDWGLYHDVERNLEQCARRLGDHALPQAEQARITQRLARLSAAIAAAPKPLRWRLRARIGERRPWHNHVEEQGA